MTNDYSKSLSKLKESLSRGDYNFIAKELKNISYQEVKKAFNSQLADENKLLKILTATQDFVTKKQKTKNAVLKRTEAILKATAKAS